MLFLRVREIKIKIKIGNVQGMDIVVRSMQLGRTNLTRLPRISSSHFVATAPARM